LDLDMGMKWIVGCLPLFNSCSLLVNSIPLIIGNVKLCQMFEYHGVR